jgi:predicted dehydrogenase
VSSVIGHADPAEVLIHGTEGTLRVGAGNVSDSGLGLRGARRGDNALADIEVPAQKIGGWRVEEEFVNAIRGKEPVTHTDLATGVMYMEWTDAVTRSLRTGETVSLPLDV